jgi:Fic family protein
MSKPPFKINDNIINMVAEITNKLGILEANFGKRKDLRLRKASKIKSVNSSCAIEANTLTEQQVAGIINGKRIIAPPDEIIEVKNAYNAYLRIQEYKSYEIKSFLKAHKTLTEHLLKDSGKFRTSDVAVYENKKVVHVGARPQFIYDHINNLFVWANASELHALIKACVLHYEIETIHPFSDGNGRIGRLWQSAILYNYNKLFELIPIETLVHKNKQRYYKSIELSRKHNSSTLFIEYMLEMISKAIDSFNGDKEELLGVGSEYMKLLTKNEKEILRIIIHDYNTDDFITMENLSEKISKANSSIRNYLKKFTDKKILIATGENRGRKYKINHGILL